MEDRQPGRKGESAGPPSSGGLDEGSSVVGTPGQSGLRRAMLKSSTGSEASVSSEADAHCSTIYYSQDMETT